AAAIGTGSQSVGGVTATVDDSLAIISWGDYWDASWGSGPAGWTLENAGVFDVMPTWSKAVDTGATGDVSISASGHGAAGLMIVFEPDTGGEPEPQTFD